MVTLVFRKAILFPYFELERIENFSCRLEAKIDNSLYICWIDGQPNGGSIQSGWLKLCNFNYVDSYDITQTLPISQINIVY